MNTRIRSERIKRWACVGALLLGGAAGCDLPTEPVVDEAGEVGVAPPIHANVLGYPTTPQLWETQGWRGSIAGGGNGPFAAFISNDAVVFQGSGWASIGSLPLFSRTIPEDTNDAGWVVGYARGTSSKPNLEQAFLYRPGHLVKAMSDVGPGSRARAVNNNGVIVGDIDPKADQGRPVRGTNGRIYRRGPGITATRLPFRLVPGEAVEWLALPAWATAGYAYDINDSGRTVGEVETSSGTVAYLWLPDGTGVSLSTASPGPGHARAINNANKIVGWVGDGPNVTAMAWSQDGFVIQTLGAGARATDINDVGTVVGVKGNVPINSNRNPLTIWWAFVQVGTQLEPLSTLPNMSGNDYVIDVRINACGTVMAEGERSIPYDILRWGKKGCAY